MAKSLPNKLLLVGGSDADAQRLARKLGDDYKVVAAESEEDDVSHIRHVIDSISEGVALCAAGGELLWSNDRFGRLSDEIRAQVVGLCARSRPEKIRMALEVEGRIYRVLVNPVDDADAESLLSVEVRDVTDTRRRQRRLSQIDWAGRELMRIEADAVRKMNAQERLSFLQDKIIQNIKDLLGFDYFSIRLVDASTNTLSLVMSAGLPDDIAVRDVKLAMKGSGIIGRVAATGRAYVCNNIEQDEHYSTGMSEAASSLTVPLLLQDQVIGVFNIESSVPEAFDDDDRRYAETFARYIAMSIHILDLLVVERSSTNAAVSGRVVGEVQEPLEDLAAEAEWLRTLVVEHPEVAPHVDRILLDVESIRRRVNDVARGPRSLLGAEKALREEGIDPALEGKRILVADDEENIRETIASVLSQCGCVVVSAKTGAEAIAALEASAQSNGADASKEFDLVISDIKMPDRNGYEVFTAAKTIRAQTPVILMTGFGYDPHHSIVRASQAGLRCVLFKPFQIERLLDEVRQSLNPKPA